MNFSNSCRCVEIAVETIGKWGGKSFRLKEGKKKDYLFYQIHLMQLLPSRHFLGYILRKYAIMMLYFPLSNKLFSTSSFQPTEALHNLTLLSMSNHVSPWINLILQLGSHPSSPLFLSLSPLNISHFSHVQPFATPHQALSMGFPR